MGRRVVVRPRAAAAARVGPAGAHGVAHRARRTAPRVGPARHGRPSRRRCRRRGRDPRPRRRHARRPQLRGQGDHGGIPAAGRPHHPHGVPRRTCADRPRHRPVPRTPGDRGRQRRHAAVRAVPPRPGRGRRARRRRLVHGARDAAVVRHVRIATRATTPRSRPQDVRVRDRRAGEPVRALRGRRPRAPGLELRRAARVALVDVLPPHRGGRDHPGRDGHVDGPAPTSSSGPRRRARAGRRGRR